MHSPVAVPAPRPGAPGVETVMALWLAGIFAASLVGRATLGGEEYSLALTGAVVWPLAYFAWGPCLFLPRLPRVGAVLALAGFVLFSALSVYVSPETVTSLSYWVLTVVALLLVLQFNTHLDALGYRRALGRYALLTAALLIAFAFYDYQPGLRLGLGKDLLNPNAVSMVAFSVFLAATLVRPALPRYLLMLCMGLLLVLTGSRAASLAAAAGVAVVLLRRLATAPPWQRLAAAALLAAGVSLGLAYAQSLLGFVNEYYALDSADRGLDSGFTGRVTAWHEAWQLLLGHPLFGVGFRAHEMLMHTRSSAHNGYLALLAEIGMVGAACVAYLVAVGLGSLWRGLKDPEWAPVSAMFIGLCLGFLLLAGFERYLINVGNPTSVLFLLGILRPAYSPVPTPRTLHHEHTLRRLGHRACC